MKILKIIGIHKKIKKSKPVKHGFIRAEAIVEDGKLRTTRHIDIAKDNERLMDFLKK